LTDAEWAAENSRQDYSAWRPDREPVPDIDRAPDGRVRGVTVKGEDVQASVGGPLSEIVLGVDPDVLLGLVETLLSAARDLVRHGASDEPSPDTLRAAVHGLAVRPGPGGWTAEPLPAGGDSAA
jgi:hypothetical protein